MASKLFSLDSVHKPDCTALHPGLSLQRGSVGVSSGNTAMLAVSVPGCGEEAVCENGQCQLALLPLGQHVTIYHMKNCISMAQSSPELPDSFE